jgi:hypothetical protein
MSDLVEKVNDGNFEQVVLHSSVQGVSSWQLIFQQSKVNNGAYDGDRLPAQNWHWPQGTWLQKRLRYLRRSNDRDAKEYTAKKLQ